MSSFQRMVVIPQEEYFALSSMQNVNEPLAQHFHDLENRYITEGKDTDQYRRMMLQSNTLNQMKQVKDRMRNSLTVSTPKPYQSRANALLQTLESFLKFNDKGEIYLDDGALLPNTRLEDLIQHAVRDRRRNMTPTGWPEFLNILREHNVPKSIINRDTLDEMDTAPMPQVKTEVTDKEETSVKAKSKGIKQSELHARQQPKRKEKPSSSAIEKKLKFLRTFK